MTHDELTRYLSGHANWLNCGKRFFVVNKRNLRHARADLSQQVSAAAAHFLERLLSLPCTWGSRIAITIFGDVTSGLAEQKGTKGN